MYVCISMYNLIPRIDTHIVSKLKRIKDLIQDYIFESSAGIHPFLYMLYKITMYLLQY